MSTNKTMNKQIVVYPCNGLLLSNKKIATGIHNNINESQKNDGARSQTQETTKCMTTHAHTHMHVCTTMGKTNPYKKKS